MKTDKEEEAQQREVVRNVEERLSSSSSFFALTFENGQMKNNLAAKLHGEGIGAKSKAKLTVGTFVDERATAKAAEAELEAQGKARAKAVKKPKAATAEVPLKNETIYFPIGTLGEVDAISGNKVAILIGGSSIHVQLDEIELWVPPAPIRSADMTRWRFQTASRMPLHPLNSPWSSCR